MSAETTSTFMDELVKGLTCESKFISSKYLYDTKGDELFQQIMKMEEYYLTACEYEILDTYKSQLVQLFNQGKEGFDLIEFGAGDGYKTKVLISELIKEKVDFTYMPIDISANAINMLQIDLEEEFPSLKVTGIGKEYFDGLKELHAGKRKKVILFMGSNIGNFKEEEAVAFLFKIREHLSEEDYLMVGFDLKKDPKVILDAYNDKKGITSAFNFNLLDRINYQFDGDFNKAQFVHYPNYDPYTGECRSYLLSLQEQDVFLKKLSLSVHFKKWEAIHTEISKKYNMDEIEKIALKSGITMVQNFPDTKKYYVDCLFKKK